VLSKKAFVIFGTTLPLAFYAATCFWYAYGSYNGKNCAGLLDAVWECSELEYYLDWLINPFTLITLIAYCCISAVITPLIWYGYKKYNKQRQHRPAGWTR
jgi:hypothetical protein